MMCTHAILKMTKFEKHVSKISFLTDFIDPDSCNHFQWEATLQVLTPSMHCSFRLIIL